MDARWGSGALQTLADSMTGQESAGALGSLLLRLARFLGGDPSVPVSVTSTTFTDTQRLPDDVRMQAAVLQVSGNGIFYRVDGGDPSGPNGMQAVIGATITITGLPTYRAFRFVAASALSATLTGVTFD